MKQPLKPKGIILKKPNSNVSLVLFRLILLKRPITVGDFQGYPRISEYIRVLRKKYNLEIKTIPIKFTTQFGTKSEYASYKLISETKFGIAVFEKLISK